MKYSVRTHSYESYNYDTFEKVMEFFNARYFINSDNLEDGYDFLHNMGDYLDETKYPCDKIQLDVFTGYYTRFSLNFYYNGNHISWVQIEFKENGLRKVTNYSYENSGMEMFHHIIEKYFDSYNNRLVKSWIKKCGINTNTDNEVVVLNYKKYKPDGNSVVLNGSLEYIFEKYTTHNDRLKYCNGDYWRFANKDIQTLYCLFTSNYKGNYFLDNAVKRGCIID